MFKNLYIKFFLLFLLFSIIISMFIFFLNKEILNDTTKKISKLDAESFYGIHKNLLENNIYEAKSSLNFISKNDLFHNYLLHNENDEYIKNLFFSVVHINHEILQIRYLDENGIEKIRLNHYQNSVPKFTNENKLQD